MTFDTFIIFQPICVSCDQDHHLSPLVKGGMKLRLLTLQRDTRSVPWPRLRNVCCWRCAESPGDLLCLSPWLPRIVGFPRAKSEAKPLKMGKVKTIDNKQLFSKNEGQVPHSSLHRMIVLWNTCGPRR